MLCWWLQQYARLPKVGKTEDSDADHLTVPFLSDNSIYNVLPPSTVPADRSRDPTDTQPVDPFAVLCGAGAEPLWPVYGIGTPRATGETDLATCICDRHHHILADLLHCQCSTNYLGQQHPAALHATGKQHKLHTINSWLTKSQCSNCTCFQHTVWDAAGTLHLHSLNLSVV